MAANDDKSLIEEVNDFMDAIQRGKQLLGSFECSRSCSESGEQKQDDFGDVCDSQK